MRGAAQPRLVLASSSPRRRELLALIGVTPDDVVAPEVDETPRPGETPEELVLRLAEAKALAGIRLVAERRMADGEVVIVAADTVVAPDGEILGKPVDRDDADRMLQRLSGRAHRVFTGIGVAPDGSPAARRTDSVEVLSSIVRTDVEFRALSDDDLAWYLRTREWEGRAGAYAIQGAAGFLVAGIRGSYHNVVGLPLCEVVQALLDLGLLTTFPLR